MSQQHLSGFAQARLFAAFFFGGKKAEGEIFHTDEYIFGPALVQTVELEAKAKMPRVILSTDVLQDLNAAPTGNNYLHSIGCDADGLRYVQYIENWGCVGHQSEFMQLRETILSGLRNQDIEEKYRWLAEKFNARLEAQAVQGVNKIIL